MSTRPSPREPAASRLRGRWPARRCPTPRSGANVRKPVLSSVLSLLLAGAGGYGVLLLLLYATQSGLLFLPHVGGRELVASPADIGLAFETVRVETEDGVALHGWFVPARAARRGSLLFFHGNAGNISHRLGSLRIFHGLDLDVLIIDYRGYGQSGGEPDEAGTYRDAVAAWRHLVEARGARPERVVLFGRSLGASVAAWLAARLAEEGTRPAGLILESAFTSVPDLAADLYPWLPARRLARLRYDTRASLAAVNCPVLVAHSPADEIIPYAHGRALHAAAPAPKAFLELRGGHNEGFLASGEAYVAGLRAFLDLALPARSPP